MKGYYQLIEGHGGGFMFTLRAGNHETILESRVYWSRQAAMDAVQRVRECSADPLRYVRRESAEGLHYFELLDDKGQWLGRSTGCASRSALPAGIASVQRNAGSQVFRGLVRRTLIPG
jgi:uncharacterized protein YegP (UPF0339 family)